MDEEEDEYEPSEDELAACALVVELVRSGRVLTYIGDILVERVDEVDFPGEPLEAVVLRRFIDKAMPDVLGEGAEANWKAAGLIESVREALVTDFQLEIDSDERRN